MPVEAKTCETCGQEKPATAFLPARWAPGGLTPNCRSCVFARAREYDAERGRQARTAASYRVGAAGAKGRGARTARAAMPAPEAAE